MHVELKQLVGTPLGDPNAPPVYHGVDRVYADGRLVGYINHAPNSHICFCINFPERQRLEITKAVSMIRQGNPVSLKVAMPPPQDQIDEAIEKIQAEDPDEDDDE